MRRYIQSIRDFELEDPNSSMDTSKSFALAFQDMQPETICTRFPNADLPLKRRLRCVAEYLIRSGEFDKVKDKNGKLIKKRGIFRKNGCNLSAITQDAFNFTKTKTFKNG